MIQRSSAQLSNPKTSRAARGLNEALTTLPGVGPAKAAALARLGLKSINDLLRWWPRRYWDGTHPTPISELTIGQAVTVLATVKSVHSRRSRRGQAMVTALLADDTGTVEALWFGQSYLATVLTPGQPAAFYGVVRRHYQTGRPVLSAPLVEREVKIIPIYPLTEGVSSRWLHRLIGQALATVGESDDGPGAADPLPAADRARLDLVSQSAARRMIHQPKTMAEVAAARRRLVFDELYALQRQLAAIRAARRRQSGAAVEAVIPLLRRFVRSLPFTLTDDQRRAIWQMAGELAAGRPPLHRLLNGDVGSGKTIVAAALALLTVRAGYRVAVMAPTAILAHQHARTLSETLAPFKIKVGLVTAAVKELDRPVLVGTHALLAAGVKLNKVALVVIDEQHRFGVAQREKLVAKAAGSFYPHLLALTATPIPRSLALILFGDLDISLLRTLPAGRQPVVTQVLTADQESAADTAIRAALTRGEQVFVICPLIEDVVNEAVVADERQSVIRVFRRIRTAFPQTKVAMLHGQQKKERQQSILEDFCLGRLGILVATSVVEVGVDMPQATVMVIENAERFGVAQLHQLRGRVGRRDKPAVCFLLVREPSPAALARCQKVASTADGFELARFDLRSRGPGELVGLAQKGFNRLLLEDLDFDLLAAAHDFARRRA